MKTFWSCALLILGCALAPLQAQEYNEPTLIFNSSSENGYNMPAETIFTDRSPSINDNREMAITLTFLGGTYETGVWVKSKYQEGILLTSGTRESFSDVQINNQGNLFFTHQTLDGIKGVYTATGLNEGGYKLINNMDDEDFFPYSSFNNLYLSQNDELLFTAKNFKGDLGIFNYHIDSGVELIQAQNQRSTTSYSYLFTPSYNDKGNVAYKVRVGGRGNVDEQLPDQIILSKDSKKIVLVEDRDSNPKSKWKSFRNNIALNNSGSIAFIAKDEEGEKLILLETDGQETVLAISGKDLKEFSFFSFVINDKNAIAFRGIDLKGNHAIYMATKNKLRKVLTQFDKIKVPWGEALIAYGPHAPFNGHIDMNNHGDIILNTGLANLDNTDDFGNGVVVIYTKE